MRHALFPVLLALVLAGCTTTEPIPSPDTGRVTELERQLAQVQKERDTARQEAASLRGRVRGLEGDLQEARVANRATVDHLSDQQARFENLRQEYQRRIDELAVGGASQWNGDVEFTQRDGDLYMTVAAEVLFTPGSAEIQPRGRRALEEVRRVLNEDFPDRAIEVAGHTDSDKIQKSRKLYTSNMDLSLERARAVYDALTSAGVTGPERVRAVGYGPHRPRADNASEEGKKLNRRVEIVVLGPSPTGG